MAAPFETSFAQLQDPLMRFDEEDRPKFGPSKDIKSQRRVDTRKVQISPHRMTPLKAAWRKIYPPLVEHLRLQIRMNIRAKAVELRTSSHTAETGALNKAEEFIKAFNLGFERMYLRSHLPPDNRFWSHWGNLQSY